jgi:Reverse transcriptase (RNA-dependent DNA polymerase)
MEYHSISIINVISKLISKFLANSLQRGLSNLIHDHWMTFVQGGQISKNFLVIREILHHKKARVPAIFLKIDFLKAFDCVN